ncbi:MAG: cupin domain-containing protein [Hyphomicrobium sp.]|jgi:hypothetical protein
MAQVIRATIDPDDFELAPIPEAWIVEGNPLARSRLLARSLDGTTVTSQWDCTAGSFNWHFGCEETVHILEGEVHVTDETGASYTLRAGDVAVFHAGMKALWDVRNYVRKLAVCRHPVPQVIGLALRATSKLGELFYAKRLLAFD